MGDKSGAEAPVFATYSIGLKTQRDAWAYSPSSRALSAQMSQMVHAYNAEVARFDAAHPGADRKTRAAKVDAFVDWDSKRISWSRGLKNELVKGTRLSLRGARIVPALYRPFTKQWLCFDRKLNEMVYQMPRLFPHGADNRLMMVNQGSIGVGQIALLTDVIPDIQGCVQCFPLYVYEPEGKTTGSSMGRSEREDTHLIPQRRDGLTDSGLEHFQAAYPQDLLTKEDVFYYIYGILHATDYRERYGINLRREIPRIPRVRTAKDFWAFSNAGRALGELHVGYETVAEFPAEIEGSGPRTAAHYRVDKMRFGKGKDKTVIHYNSFLTVRHIPLEAYDYIVNGKSAIEWVMERQCVAVDKDSGIKKDANDWAIETVGDSRYPLSLLLRVVTVSLETVKLVNALPKLDILQSDEAVQGVIIGG